MSSVGIIGGGRNGGRGRVLSWGEMRGQMKKEGEDIIIERRGRGRGTNMYVYVYVLTYILRRRIYGTSWDIFLSSRVFVLVS